MCTLGMNRSHLAVGMLCLCAATAGYAQTYDYTWQASFGVTRWAGSDTAAPNYYGNGWGHTWHWTVTETVAYYPSLGQSVLIPAGMTCGSGDSSWGDSPAYCGPLTIEAGATVDRRYGHLYTNGPVIQNYGQDVLIGAHFGFHGDTALEGPGDYHLFEDAAVVGVDDYRTLTIGADVEMYGLGAIGKGAPSYGTYPLSVVNNGVIRATPHSWRRLDVWTPGTTIFTNNNLLEAAPASGDGAELLLRGTYANANGVIRANEGSVVLLSGSGGSGPTDTRVVGGTLQSIGTGQIQATGGDSLVIEDVQLDGTLRIVNGASPAFKTAIDVKPGGLLQVGPDYHSFNGSQAQIAGDFSLGGAGQTLIGYGCSLYAVTGLATAPTLTVEAGHTVRMIEYSDLGYPNGGTRTPAIVNKGTIAFDPILAGYTSAGDIHAHNGFVNQGRLYVGHSDEEEGGLYIRHSFSQTAGELISDGHLRFQGCGTVSITGGTMGGHGTFSFSSSSLQIGPGATLAPGASTGTMTIAGAMAVQDGADYAFEIGDTAADRILVTGQLDIQGVLNIILMPYQLTQPRTVDVTLFEFGSLIGSPVFHVTGPADWSWGSVVRDGNTFVLQDVMATPEPATLALVLLTAAMTAVRVRRFHP